MKMQSKDQNGQPKSIMTKIRQRSITIICLGLLIFSAYKLTSVFWDYYQNRQVLAEIQQVYVPESIEKEATNVTRSSFDPLLDINEEIAAWIKIDGTNVDYPILQAEDNQFYLNRNYLHQETRAGSLFLDYRNDLENNDLHTIVYGHNMRDGSMFGQLDQFLDQDFYEDHPTFQYDSLYQSYDVEIFAAYVTTTDFYYIETNFADTAAYRGFLNEITAKSQIETETTVTEDDQIITLSTCDYQLDRDKGRFVVHGKLIPKT
ncbi:class B sortase [Gracilibacillus suaedae]|uniref:class B sortase n=1 Tax=Gracilibacillus suaedae TaxID=2820273 RepID=UPI0038B38D59